jgi:hypothetical protein
MIIKCTLTLGITFAWKLQMCRALVGKVNKHQIGPHDTIRKVLQRKCFKCHRIVHLDLLCISYDQKKGRESNWKFDSRRQIPWKQGSMRSTWSVLYTVYKIFSSHSHKNLIWEKYERPKFWDNKNPNFGSPREKWHLDIITAERHIIYYKEGSCASSQRLWVV